MADLLDLCWLTGGSCVLLFGYFQHPKACYLLVSGLPPQSLSPMVLKDGTGPRPAAYGAYPKSLLVAGFGAAPVVLKDGTGPRPAAYRA